MHRLAIEFFADGAPLPADLVAQQELALAERRSIVFKPFLRYYETVVVAGVSLDSHQQQCRDKNHG